MRAVLRIFSSVFSFCKIKGYFNENVSFTDYAFPIRLPDCSNWAINRKKYDDITICWCDVIASFFDVDLFLLSRLVTGPSFMSISSLDLELWQFSFIRDWPEIRKSEIPSSEFLPISGDRSELGIRHLARMSLIKYYWMLQSNRIATFTVFELLRENQQESGVKLPLCPTQIRVKN